MKPAALHHSKTALAYEAHKRVVIITDNPQAAAELLPFAFERGVKAMVDTRKPTADELAAWTPPEKVQTGA